MVIQTIVSYTTSIFKHGGATNFGLASATSALVVGGLQFSDATAHFKEQIDLSDFIMVALIESVLFMFYVGLTLVNLAAGLQASKHEHKIKKGPKSKKYIEIDRLWRVMWKSLGMLLLTLMVAFVALILSFADFRMLFWGTIWFLIVFWLLANSYEFYSIGVNIERRFGKKPKIYAFADKVISIFEKSVINRIEKSCNEPIDSSTLDKLKEK